MGRLKVGINSRLIGILLSVLCTMPSGVYAKDISFKSLTTTDGLSHNTVESLYKDERGFIWIGTRGKLNFFNGNEITTYTPSFDDPSVVVNQIYHISGNGRGKVYILSDCVVEYDIQKDRFNILLPGRYSTMFYKNNALYLSCDNVIWRYDLGSGTIEKLRQIETKGRDISSLFVDAQDNIWVGTHTDGLYLIKNSGATAQQLIPKLNISNIYQDSKGRIWVGSLQNGAFCFEAGEVVDNFINDPYNPQSLSSDFVTCFCEDDNGDMWLGTVQGLNKYDENRGVFENSSIGNRKGSISSSSIWCMIKDDQGTIWIGTYFGGVNYFNPQYELFTYYQASDVEAKGLSSPLVGRIVEDNRGDLWICTEAGGLNYYNRQTNTFRWFKHNPFKNSISQNILKSIYYDPQRDVLWIGTHLGGLNRLDISTEKFTCYRSEINNPNALPSDIIRDIIPYKSRLIVATDSGVGLFDPKTGRYENIKNIYAKTLLIDHSNNLWFTSLQAGVYSYQLDTKRLKHYTCQPGNTNSISSNDINNIELDSNNNLWFATSSKGIDLYRSEEDRFEHYNIANSNLSSDQVYSIKESSSGNIIIATNKGLCLFNPKERTFTNFNNENGFMLSVIDENALFISRDNTIFMAGLQGMVSFREQDLYVTPKPYKISPYRLFLNNKQVKVNDQTGVLNSALCSLTSLKIESKYSVLTIEFATSNFIPANKSNILYKLKGFSPEWIDTRGQSIITYTNLLPGRYQLMLKADKTSIEQCPISILDIEILPPFYKTWLAYLIYFILTVAILLYIIKNYISHLTLRASLQYQKQHTKDIEKLNQSKLAFFTNISHEFRTPLTLIIGCAETLLQTDISPKSAHPKLKDIYRNSTQLMALISELLDFRKQEQGHLKIKVSQGDLVTFLYETHSYFKEYASSRKINFNFEKEVDNLHVWFDSQNLQKVVNNLLSNAFKYTDEFGTITLRVKELDNSAVFEVVDNGCGITQQTIPKLFDSFFDQQRIDEHTTGTGIGLALSKGIVELHRGTIDVSSREGAGSTFVVKLKLGKEHFEAEQIVENTLPDCVIGLGRFDLALYNGAQTENEKRLETIKKKKIVIAEDNDALRGMLADIFSHYYSVFQATNGEQAYTLVKAESPDIVVSDIMMPAMTGTQLCRAIKSDINICHIPVVLLTAKAAMEHNIEGLQAGADDYITKPFNISLLISRCNNLINNRILLQQKFGTHPRASEKMLTTNPLDEKFMSVVVKYIYDNLDNTELRIDHLTREMGISRTTFFEKVKAISGQTPNEFINTIRLKESALLLDNNPLMSVSEISDKVGFSCPKYFSRSFKATYNISPSLYRHRVKERNEPTK